MKRKIISMLLAAAMLSSLLAGCSGPGGGKSETLTLSPEATTVTTSDGITVEVGDYVLDGETELTVTKQPVEENKEEGYKIEAYDFTLGELHELGDYCLLYTSSDVGAPFLFLCLLLIFCGEAAVILFAAAGAVGLCVNGRMGDAVGTDVCRLWERQRLFHRPCEWQVSIGGMAVFHISIALIHGAASSQGQQAVKGQRHIPVSYTHLDVYKRQARKWSKLNQVTLSPAIWPAL